MPPAITVDSIVRSSDDQISARLPGDAVILDLASGTYYGFEGIGAAVWELLQGQVRVADLRDQLVARYEVSAEKCDADLLGLLTEMLEKKLIVVVEEDAFVPRRD